ncbi:uncharacterized protein LOC130630509 [Hydractinia symbiolongicarpus]|uniref:uncharacterized protein LOC130630509 n=1 Tax=Hydractinia symbiolongicarpus TaxID=13093 RepID=UPI00254E4231|nr:uncharacterized protein LOC130630509 [Hydractinia symbiolongicarpus]
MSSNFTVIGFQYEPERSEAEIAAQPRPVYNDDGNDQVLPCENSRMNKPVNEWCRCGNCERMPTGKECLRCVDVDAIKYFHLNEQECITQHPHFYWVVLPKDALWTALVALHDRESRGIPERDNVPNKYFLFSFFSLLHLHDIYVIYSYFCLLKVL